MNIIFFFLIYIILFFLMSLVYRKHIPAAPREVVLYSSPDGFNIALTSMNHIVYKDRLLINKIDLFDKNKNLERLYVLLQKTYKGNLDLESVLEDETESSSSEDSDFIDRDKTTRFVEGICHDEGIYFCDPNNEEESSVLKYEYDKLSPEDQEMIMDKYYFKRVLLSEAYYRIMHDTGESVFDNAEDQPFSITIRLERHTVKNENNCKNTRYVVAKNEIDTLDYIFSVLKIPLDSFTHKNSFERCENTRYMVVNDEYDKLIKQTLYKIYGSAIKYSYPPCRITFDVYYNIITQKMSIQMKNIY